MKENKHTHTTHDGNLHLLNSVRVKFRTKKKKKKKKKTNKIPACNDKKT